MKPIPLRSEISTARRAVRLLMGLGACALAGAVFEWHSPSFPPYKGRRGWLAEAAYAMGGATGVIVLWLLLAATCAGCARWLWQRTAKRPSDRWFG